MNCLRRKWYQPVLGRKEVNRRRENQESLRLLKSLLQLEKKLARARKKGRKVLSLTRIKAMFVVEVEKRDRRTSGLLILPMIIRADMGVSEVRRVAGVDLKQYLLLQK